MVMFNFFVKRDISFISQIMQGLMYLELNWTHFEQWIYIKHFISN